MMFTDEDDEVVSLSFESTAFAQGASRLAYKAVGKMKSGRRELNINNLFRRKVCFEISYIQLGSHC